MFTGMNINEVAKSVMEQTEAPDFIEEMCLVEEISKDHIRISKAGHGVALICTIINAEALLTGRDAMDVAAEVAARVLMMEEALDD